MVLDRNDLIFTIETVLKAAGHVWRPEIEPPLPEVAADAVLLLISRKQPATPPASEPSRDAMVELINNEWVKYINDTGGRKVEEWFADFCLDQLAHFAGQRAEVAALKIALADAIRCPMGVCPDSAVGLLTVEELKDAENRRIEGKSPAIKHSGLTGEKR